MCARTGNPASTAALPGTTSPQATCDASYARMRTSRAPAREELGSPFDKLRTCFFRIFLSSLRIRFSRRSHLFSRAKSVCSADTRSVGQYCDTHLPSVDNPTPKSAATRRRYGLQVESKAPPTTNKFKKSQIFNKNPRSPDRGYFWLKIAPVGGIIAKCLRYISVQFFVEADGGGATGLRSTRHRLG
jgi:hypothetical protein